MADDRKITIEIEAKDYASSIFRNVTSGISTFSARAYTGIYNANNALRAYNNTMMGFNYTVQRALVAAGRAIYNFTEDAIKQFAALEQQHAKTMGAMSSNYNFNTSSGLQKFQADSATLMNQAIYMGYYGATGNGSLHSPQEISAAQTALIKAGISPSDIINTNALSDVIKFAGAGDLSLDTAVEFAVQLGSQFDYLPSEWGGMLDQVTYAANASIIDVEDIIESMKYAGNMASGYDQPLNEVLAALAVMGQSGLKGSQAGTGIQAIFSRGMSTTGVTTAGKAPNQHVQDVYDGFVDQVVDENGKFLGLGNFTDVLTETTDALSDQEKAWFYRKLFGMYQQKAGLALTGAGENEMSYQDYVDAIIENAAGTNDKVYEIALETTYGELESVENAWLAFKTEFGQDLSPITKSVAQQLRNALVDKDFNFDTDVFREKIEEAGELLAEDFGTDIANAFVGVGNFMADAIDVGLAQAPLITSSATALLQLLDGDFSGGWETFKSGIEGVNENIDDLPPELQDTANAIRNLILLFEGLFALNIVTRIGEGVTSVLRLMGMIGWLKNGGRLVSTNASVASANATVNGTSVIVNGGTIASAQFGAVSNATVASMMANTNTMTVYASIVNIIGGGSGLGGGGGTPILGGGGPLLPTLAAGGGAALGAGAAAAALGSGATAALPGAVAAGAGAVAAGAGATTLYVIGGKAYSASQLAKLVGLGALKVAGTVGLAYGAISTLGSSGLLLSEDKRVNNDSAGIDKTVAEIASGSTQPHGLFETGKQQTLDDYFVYGTGGGLYYARNHPDYIENGGTKTADEIIADEIAGRYEARTEMMELYKSLEGATILIETMNEELAQNGNLSEDFWTQILTYTGSNGYTYTGSNEDAKELLRTIFPDFDNTYRDSLNYSGRFNESKLSSYVENNIGNIDLSMLPSILEATQTASISLSEAVNKLVQDPGFVLGLGQGPLSQQGAYDYIMGQFGSSGIAANQTLLEQINQGITAIDPEVTVDITNPPPIVNVDVNVNVDKYGNVTQDIIKNYSVVDSWMYKSSQRYSGTN